MPALSRRPAGASDASTDATTGANPSVDANETHGQVGVDGAFDAPTNELGTTVADQDRVKVLHDDAHKLRKSDGAAPAPEELFERSSFFGNLWGTFHLDPAYHDITEIEGTPARPAVNYDHAVTDSLFINGAPSLADIHQGGLADCYFLASVTSIVQNDPGQIREAITGTAGGATVRLYRKDGTNILPVNLAVTSDLRVEDLGDGATGASPLGAGMRAAPTPKYTEYYADITGTTLHIYADRYYETAMWAPLLEKAYAQFAGQYGQYGGFHDEDKARPGADGAPSSDYGYLNGGIAQYSYELMYGPDAVNVGALQWTTTDGSTPAAGTLAANAGIVQNLLWASQIEVPSGQKMMMTVGADRGEMIERLDRMSTPLLARADMAGHADLATDIRVMQGHIATWRTATGDDKDTALGDVSHAAADVVNRSDHPELYDAASPREYRDYGENANIVAMIRTDHGGDQRHTYAWHSYTVLGSTFKKADGTVLSLAPSTCADHLSEIDPLQSTVRLRNPHGTNEPNLQATDGTDDGEFTMTLDSFTRSFSFQQFGVVRT
jgi:hypothetical protein